VSNTTVTYYPYVEVKLANGSAFNIYSGTPVTASAQPASAVKWKPRDANAGYASYYDGTGWVQRIDVRTLTLAQLQKLCIGMAQQSYESAMDELTTGYTPSEKQSWAHQMTEATLVLSGGESALISTLAQARGQTVMSLAQKIVSKGTTLSSASTAALATLQKARTQINAATSIEGLPVLTLDALRNGLL